MVKNKLKKEDNAYSQNLGVDDIEDIIDAGLDWTQDDFEYPKDEPRDYDDPSKLITIADAERILGPRPDVPKPKPPVSKKPRPDTIRKYKEDVLNYKSRLKELDYWEKKYDALASLVQLLKNTNDFLDELEEDIVNWCSYNPGTFIIRVKRSNYGILQDPASLVSEIRDKWNIPKNIESLKDKADWAIRDIDFDEEKDIFPSVLITVNNDKNKGKNIQYRLISITDNLNEISDIIEDYVETIQPKDLGSYLFAKLDYKTNKILEDWNEIGLTNSQLTDEQKELKLFIASSAFLKEIQQFHNYPDYSPVGKLVDYFLKQI